jgi:hypothetical protein
VDDATTRMLHGLEPNTVRLIGTTGQSRCSGLGRVPDGLPDGLMPEQVRGLLEQAGGPLTPCMPCHLHDFTRPSAALLSTRISPAYGGCGTRRRGATQKAASEPAAASRLPQTSPHGRPDEAVSPQTSLLRPAQPHPSPSRIPARWIQA